MQVRMLSLRYGRYKHNTYNSMLYSLFVLCILFVSLTKLPLNLVINSIGVRQVFVDLSY